MGVFDDKVVIITGGAYGIGLSTALEFAKEGAKVSIADINAESGAELEASMEKDGLEGLFIHADIADSTQCAQVVNRTVSAFGGIDILFNNAGIQMPNSYLNVESTPEEMWDRIINVNLKSYFLMSKYAIPEMRTRGGGVIINNASVQGLQSQKLVPAYAASKGGVLSLTRQMALDYAPENIRVLAVCPGAIDTGLLRAQADLEPGDQDETIHQWGESHPLGRIGTGQDIANVVLFLASARASFMTGEHVCVDGGYMAMGAWASTTDTVPSDK